MVNKVDHLEADEVDEIRRFITGKVADAVGATRRNCIACRLVTAWQHIRWETTIRPGLVIGSASWLRSNTWSLPSWSRRDSAPLGPNSPRVGEELRDGVLLMRRGTLALDVETLSARVVQFRSAAELQRTAFVEDRLILEHDAAELMRAVGESLAGFAHDEAARWEDRLAEEAATLPVGRLEEGLPRWWSRQSERVSSHSVHARRIASSACGASLPHGSGAQRRSESTRYEGPPATCSRSSFPRWWFRLWRRSESGSRTWRPGPSGERAEAAPGGVRHGLRRASWSNRVECGGRPARAPRPSARRRRRAARHVRSGRCLPTRTSTRSSVVRCSVPAKPRQPIVDATGATLACDDAFVDRDYGPWAGMARAEVEARYGSLDRAPEIEPMGSLVSRVVFAAREVAARFDSVVIVGHDVVNRALLATVGVEHRRRAGRDSAAHRVLEQARARRLAVGCDGGRRASRRWSGSMIEYTDRRSAAHGVSHQ